MLGLGTCLALSFEGIAGFSEPSAGLGQRLAVAVEGLPQLSQLDRVGDLRGVTGVRGRYELRDRPSALDGVVEPEAEFVADAYGGQGPCRVEQVAVRGLVPVTTHPVEVITDLGDEYPGTRQRGQPVDLPVALDPHADAGDQFLGEDLTELSGLDQGRVRVREYRGFRRSAVKGEQRLVLVQDPEVR